MAAKSSSSPLFNGAAAQKAQLAAIGGESAGGRDSPPRGHLAAIRQ